MSFGELKRAGIKCQYPCGLELGKTSRFLQYRPAAPAQRWLHGLLGGCIGRTGRLIQQENRRIGRVGLSF
jgi:hypothetical protein